VEDSIIESTRHTLQYAGDAEDVEKIKELAEGFVSRKKIHNRYKIRTVDTEMNYLNEAKTEASVALIWEFEDEADSWPFIRRLYRYLQLRMTGSADGMYAADGSRAYKSMPIVGNVSVDD
tara:strand:- start:3760 stop:4119 length:360 start_codon:yes stop_codon:yes gene_type:complete